MQRKTKRLSVVVYLKRVLLKELKLLLQAYPVWVKVLVVMQVQAMLLHLLLLKLLRTCTAGVKIQLLLPNFNLTAKTDSVSVKVVTSTLFSHSNTTPVIQIRVSTYTPLLFAQKNINHLALAISPELT